MWLADLAAVADDVLALLCREERARAARFARDRDRVLWGRAHGVLRQLLGRYLAHDPAALRFASGAHGKPALLDVASAAGRQDTADRPASLFFNLSHSANLAVYALSANGEVGVDVEVARRPIDELALAARALGPAETERLALLEPASRTREFRRAWARHEAVLKYRGTGIGGAGEDTHAAAPWIAELDVGERAAAAVAAASQPLELRCWSWQA